MASGRAGAVRSAARRALSRPRAERWQQVPALRWAGSIASSFLQKGAPEHKERHRHTQMQEVHGRQALAGRAVDARSGPKTSTATKKKHKTKQKAMLVKMQLHNEKPFPRAPMPEKLSSEDLMTGLITRWISAIERVELNSRGRFLFRKCFCGARRKRLFNCPAAVFSNAPQSGRLFSFAVSPVTNRKKDEKKSQRGVQDTSQTR